MLRALPRHFKWLVVGAVDDQATSDLRQTLQDTVDPDRFMLLPRASREALNAFYCAADLGVYTVPAISIMEAAGTGLPMIFPQTESLKALGELGFHPGTWGGAADVNADAIRKADPESDARMARAERANCHLSWPVQAERLIAWMEEVRTDRNSGKVPSNN